MKTASAQGGTREGRTVQGDALMDERPERVKLPPSQCAAVCPLGDGPAERGGSLRDHRSPQAPAWSRWGPAGAANRATARADDGRDDVDRSEGRSSHGWRGNTNPVLGGFPSLAASTARPFSKNAQRRAHAQQPNPYRPRIAEINERAAQRLQQADRGAPPLETLPGETEELSARQLRDEVRARAQGQGVSSVTVRDGQGRLLSTTAPDIYRRHNTAHVKAAKFKKKAESISGEKVLSDGDSGPPGNLVEAAKQNPGRVEEVETLLQSALTTRGEGGRLKLPLDVFALLGTASQEGDRARTVLAGALSSSLPCCREGLVAVCEAAVAMAGARLFAYSWPTSGTSVRPGLASSGPSSLPYAEDEQLFGALALLQAISDAETRRLRHTFDDSRVALPPSLFYVSAIDATPLTDDWAVADLARAHSPSRRRALCHFPATLSLGAKMRIFRHAVGLGRSTLERQWLSRRLFAGEPHPSRTGEDARPPWRLELRIERSRVVESSLALLSHVPDQVLSAAAISVTFLGQGEEGMDAGGLRREWFLLMAESLLSSSAGASGLFDVVEPAPPSSARGRLLRPRRTVDEAKLRRLELLGLLVGLALTHEQALDLPLATFVFKLLLAAGDAEPWSALGLDDITELSPGLAKAIADAPSLETERLEEVEAEVGISLRSPEGRLVTGYASRGARQWLYPVQDPAAVAPVRALADGFARAVPRSLRRLLSASELMTVVCGSPAPLDVAKVRAASAWRVRPSRARRRNRSVREPSSTGRDDDDDELREAFWGYWKQLGQAEARTLLKYITANDRLPHHTSPPHASRESGRGGSTAAPLLSVEVVELETLGLPGAEHDEDEGERDAPLPWSSTCTSTLYLPRYARPTRTLPKKLDVALRLGAEGFGLR